MMWYWIGFAVGMMGGFMLGMVAGVLWLKRAQSSKKQGGGAR